MAKENKGNNKGWDNLIPCKPGQTANPNGRPKGQRNFATIYREAIEKIAKSKDITADEFEIQLVEQAIRKGFNGDTRFYTDTLDRIHGKAVQKTQLQDDEGNTVQQVLVKIIRNGDNADSN